MNTLKETLYAAATTILLLFMLMMLLNGIFSTDPYYSEVCEQRRAWESTGHDYVGIPPGADHC
ncbi:MAG TPA: hypothetical protein DCL39_09300 [Alteromonas macleodii]|nr:hypothetical protein [Alteromonas macleodii]|tara:strand:- start:841 stop:1029 length:189 start_codon:yes stop_codon:yes gene_type:complete